MSIADMARSKQLPHSRSLIHTDKMSSCRSQGNRSKKRQTIFDELLEIWNSEADHSEMANLFFDLLPCDLQVDILSAWINDAECGRCLLRALSALDVACSKADRPDFHFLLCKLPAISKWNQEKSVAFIDTYMLWLHSRQVSMRTLLLGKTDPMPKGFDESRPIIVLPSVEIVDASKRTSVCPRFVEWVLCCCPNVTALKCHVSSVPMFTSELVQQVPKLTSLRISGYDTPSMALIQAIGPQLRELRCIGGSTNDHLLQAIIDEKTCAQLQILEISSFYVSSAYLGQLVHVFKCLSELVCEAASRAAITLLLGFQQLKKITIRVRHSTNTRYCCVTLADILERRPDLKWLQVGFCKYDRNEGILNLASGYTTPYTTLDATLLSRITLAITCVNEVIVCGWLTESAAEMLADKFGDTLT